MPKFIMDGEKDKIKKVKHHKVIQNQENHVISCTVYCGGLNSLCCNGDFPHGPIVVLCAGRRHPAV